MAKRWHWVERDDDVVVFVGAKEAARRYYRRHGGAPLRMKSILLIDEDARLPRPVVGKTVDDVWPPVDRTGNPRDKMYARGDRVWFYDRFGHKRSGTIVFEREDGYLTLNIGGRHGTPQVIHIDDVVERKPQRKRNASTSKRSKGMEFFYMEPRRRNPSRKRRGTTRRRRVGTRRRNPRQTAAQRRASIRNLRKARAAQRRGTRRRNPTRSRRRTSRRGPTRAASRKGGRKAARVMARYKKGHPRAGQFKCRKRTSNPRKRRSTSRRRTHRRRYY